MHNFLRLSSKDTKKMLIAAGIPLFLGILLLVFGNFKGTPTAQDSLDLPPRNDTIPEVPIMSNFGTKIVYTTNVTTDKTDYIADCKTRGGTFNACGNTCSPKAEMCTAQCAFTCELKK